MSADVLLGHTALVSCFLSSGSDPSVGRVGRPPRLTVSVTPTAVLSRVRTESQVPEASRVSSDRRETKGPEDSPDPPAQSDCR